MSCRPSSPPSRPSLRTREGQGVGVSRSAYSRVKCFFCEKGISSNALAQTNHKRMHVREV